MVFVGPLQMSKLGQGAEAVRFKEFSFWNVKQDLRKRDMSLSKQLHLLVTLRRKRNC